MELTKRAEELTKILLENAARLPDTPMGLYALIRGNEVVYIGKSENTLTRISRHIADPEKDFDSYSIIEWPPQLSLNDAEAELVMLLQPRDNKTLPINNRYLSPSQMKTKYGVSRVELRQAISSGEISVYRFKERTYLKRSELPIDWVFRGRKALTLEQGKRNVIAIERSIVGRRAFFGLCEQRGWDPEVLGVR